MNLSTKAKRVKVKLNKAQHFRPRCTEDTYSQQTLVFFGKALPHHKAMARVKPLASTSQL